ncbi:MAG TPA: RNA polymerase sigma factor [Acidimicrobiales bacterium]|jgi:RNA polymerase sigma-70 factor (ECF subfamily)
MLNSPSTGQIDLERLRAGDEHTFIELVRRHHDAMVRVARSFVPSHEVAEEVVQDTWLAVLRGLAGFEGRSSFQTWLYRILINRARSSGVREHHHVPIGDDESSLDSNRFDQGGQWSLPPEHWVDDLDERLYAGELSASIWSALDELPVQQRSVVALRDLEGLRSTEVCDLLDITAANQRVLLHRGRSRMREALETKFGKL